MTVEIFDIAFGGVGVGKLPDQKIVFVPYALPGEVVLLKNIINKSKYAKAEVASLIKSSPDRITSQCPYFKKCGGCQYHHCTYDIELSYKKSQLQEILKRIGKIDESLSIKVYRPENVRGYRNSITLHKQGKKIGFYTEDNRSIVKVSECFIANRLLNDFIKSHKKRFNEIRNKRVTIKSDGKNISWCLNKRELSRTVKGALFRYDYTTFFQTNFEILNQIINMISADLDHYDCLFDIYCGVGVYSICFKDHFKRIYGIDDGKQSIRYAGQNQGDLDTINFFCLKAEDAFADIYNSHRGRSNIVIVNPPRTGIDSRLTQSIAHLEGINKIIYISCNPATLARDLKVINEEERYVIKKVCLFDMFPRTKFFETVVVLDAL